MPLNLTHLYDNPPIWLSACFGLVLLVTLAGFYRAIRLAAPSNAGRILLGLLLWITLLLEVASTDFFLKINAVPPRFLLIILPPFTLIAVLFLAPGGRRVIDRLPIRTLTYLNVVRIPVELVLFGLFMYDQIPELMTFAGRNLDILAGLTAPLAGGWATRSSSSNRRKLVVWHILALLLLINIVALAVLSAPVPFQQLAFEQPNVGVLKFPFVGLPGVVVPIVLFGHLVSIRQLVIQARNGLTPE
ncbi:hypothetical protein [Spirosoma areae]